MYIDAKHWWCWRPLWLWWPGLWLLIYMSRVTPPGQPGQGGAHQCHWSWHRVISGYTSLVPGGCQVRPHTSKYILVIASLCKVKRRKIKKE